MVSLGDVQLNLSWKLKKCGIMLMEWSRKNVKNRQIQIEELKQRIGDIMERVDGNDLLNTLCELKEELKSAWEQEDIFWFQRARRDWLMLGDKNTRFFSIKLLFSASRRIKFLELKMGDLWLDDEDMIINKFTAFYDELFNSEDVWWNDELSGVIPMEDTCEMNRLLVAEVTEVVFQMGPYKTFEPDGFSDIFYLQFWDIIEGDAVETVLSFFKEGVKRKELNETKIIVILKTKTFELVSQFNSISLCNFAYKTISKVMVNRMKYILGGVITQNQSVFVVEPEKYLRLSNMVGQRKKMAFQTLKDRLKQKINSWSIRYILQCGKEGLFGGKKVKGREVCIGVAGSHYVHLKKRVSLWTAKGLLLKGLGRRTGDGQNVSISGDADKCGKNLMYSFVYESALGPYNLARLIACALWAIWTSRNRFIHEGEIKSGSQIADYVINLRELDGLNTNLPVRQIHTSRWVALNGLRVKINFDVVFNKHRKESCSGLVALNLGLYLELREVEIKGDSCSVICKLQEEKEDKSEIEAFIKDSKHLSLGFESCVFCYIYLESNKVTHLIATEGLKKRETTYLVNMVTSSA
ncbi:hypothetical protein J1N35_017610 [Gossypium stocksii]|uniref:RNase H type-1 domain-containing protein n=1 Tax=Gossypium stocksii TaxID=47602 RepID=A0A9D4A5W5_9ROSI|nr:hypothetical protein J1N35_017610 [Gossypium stocksii]